MCDFISYNDNKNRCNHILNDIYTMLNKNNTINILDNISIEKLIFL